MELTKVTKLRLYEVMIFLGCGVLGALRLLVWSLHVFCFSFRFSVLYAFAYYSGIRFCIMPYDPFRYPGGLNTPL